MGFQSLHNSFVEVSDESCHKQEYSILCHERFRQSIPAKAIVQPLKQPPERLVIEEGMLILVRLEQLSKHELPK